MAGATLLFEVHWLDSQPSFLSLMFGLYSEATLVSNKKDGADWASFHILERRGIAEIGLLQEAENIQT